MATASGGSASNGFFSSIASSVQSAVSSVSGAANSILPVWTQYTVAKRGTDTLSQPTTNQSALPPNLNGIGASIATNPVKAALWAGAAILAAVVVLKLIKR